MSNKSHPQDKEGNSPSFSSFSSSLTSSTVTKGMGLISSYSSPSTSPSPSPEPSDTFPESVKTSTTSSTPALDTHPIQSLSSSMPTSDSSSQSMPLSTADVPSSATPPLIDNAGTSNVSPPSNKLSPQSPIISKESSKTGLTSLPVLGNVTPVNKEEMEQSFVKESPVVEEKSVELQSSTVQKEFLEKRDESDFIANKETPDIVKSSKTNLLKPLISINSQTDTISSHQLESDTEKGADSSCSQVGKNASLSVSTSYSKPDEPVITEKSERTLTPEKMETDEITTTSYRVEDTSDNENTLTIEPSDSKLLTTNDEKMVAQEQETVSMTSESLVVNEQLSEDKEIEDVDMSTDVQQQPFEEPMEEEGTTDKLDEPDQANDVQKMVVDEMAVGNALLGSKDEVSHIEKSVLESNEEENRQHEAIFGKEMSSEEPIVAVKSTDNVGEKNTIEPMKQEMEDEIDLEEKTDLEGSSEDKVSDERELTMNKNEEHLEDTEALDEPSSMNKLFSNESEGTGDKCKLIVVTEDMEKDAEDTRVEEEEIMKKEDEDESIVEKKSDDCLEEDKAKTEEVVVEKMAEDFTLEGEEKVEVTKKDTDDISNEEDKNTLPQETSEDNVPLVQEEWEKDPVIQQHQDLSQDDNKETDTSQVIEEESNKEGREIDSQLKVQEELSEHEEIIHTRKEDGIDQNVSPQSDHLGLTNETRVAASVHAQEFTENIQTSVSGVDSEVDGIIQSKLRTKTVQQKSNKHSPDTSNISEEVEIDNEREHTLSVEGKEIKATSDLCSKQKENDSTVSMETKNNSNLCSDDQVEHTEEKSIPVSMDPSTSFRKLQSLDDLGKETQMSKDSEKEDMEINEPLEHDVIETLTTEPGSHDNKQEVVTEYKQDYVEDEIKTVMETGSGIPVPLITLEDVAMETGNTIPPPLSTLEDVAMETGSSIPPPHSTLKDAAMETGSSIPPPPHNTLEDVATETGSSISVPLEGVEDISDNEPKKEKSSFSNIPSSVGTQENVEDIIPPPLTTQENVEDINDDQSMESVFSNIPPTAQENFEDIRDDELKEEEETPISKTPQPVGLQENVEDIRDDELKEEEEVPISKTPQPVGLQENVEDIRDDELMEEEETPISKTPQPVGLQENVEDIRDDEPKEEEQTPISNILLTARVQDNVEDIRDDELKEEEETALSTIPRTQENAEDIRDDELKEEETSISKTPQPVDVREQVEDIRDEEEEVTTISNIPPLAGTQENVEDIRDDELQEQEETPINNIPLAAHVKDNVEDIGDDHLKEEEETSISKTSQPVDVQEKVEDIRDEEEETPISNIPPLAGTQENVEDIRDDELKEQEETPINNIPLAAHVQDSVKDIGDDELKEQEETSISKTSQPVDVQEKVEDIRDEEEETTISNIPPLAGTQEKVEDIRDEEEETTISNIPPLAGTQEKVEDIRDDELMEQEETPINNIPPPEENVEDMRYEEEETPIRKTPQPVDVQDTCIGDDELKATPENEPKLEEYSHIPASLTTPENVKNIVDDQPEEEQIPPDQENIEDISDKQKHTEKDIPSPMDAEIIGKKIRDEEDTAMETIITVPSSLLRKNLEDIRNNRKLMEGEVTMETEDHSPVDSRQCVVVDASKQNIKNNKKPMKGQVTMETEVHSPVSSQQNVVVDKETCTSTQRRVSSSDKQSGSSIIISTKKRTLEDTSTSMLPSSSDNQATALLSSQESLSGDKPISTSDIFGHRPPLTYPYLLSKTLPSTDNVSFSSHTLKQSLSETSSVISTPHFSHVTSLVTTSSGPPTFSSSSALTSSPSPLHTLQTIGNVHDKLQLLHPSSTTSSKQTPYTSPVSSKHLSPSAITQNTSDKLASLLPPASHVIRSTNTTTDISLGTSSSVSTQSSSTVSTSIISTLPSFAPLHPQGITMLPSFSLDSLTSYATTGSGVFPWQPNVISHSTKKPSSKSHSQKIPFTIHGNIPSLPPIMVPSWGLGISRGLQTLPDTHNTVLLPQVPFSSSAIQSGSTCDVSTTTSTLLPPVPSKVMTLDSSLSTLPTSSTVMTSMLPSTMSTPTSEGIRSSSDSNILSKISHNPLSSGFPFTSSSLVTLPQAYKPTISSHKLSQNLTDHLHQIQVLTNKQSPSEVSSTVSSSEHRTTAVEHVSTSLATPLTTSIENTHSFKTSQKTSSLPLSTLSTLLSTSKSYVDSLVQSTDKVTHSIATIRAPIIPSVIQPVVSTFNPRISRSSKSPQPLVTVVPNITTSSSIISTARVFVPPADIGVKQEDAVVGEVEKVTNQQLKLAQQKLAELQHHSYSQLSKPTDVVSNSIIGSSFM